MTNDDKKRINVGTIGHVDHGRTTLTAALSNAEARIKDMLMGDSLAAQEPESDTKQDKGANDEQ